MCMPGEKKYAYDVCGGYVRVCGKEEEEEEEELLASRVRGASF